MSSNGAESCVDTTCCLLKERSGGDTEATCDCLPDVTDCAAEAESRRNTREVEQCPPKGEGPEPMVGQCAAELENCRPSYLEENELSGCCEGTRCKTGPGDVPICQAADAPELELAKECSRFARSGDNAKIEVETTTLATSAGEITLPALYSSGLGVGPAGCLNAASLTFGSGTECTLSFRVDMSGGKLALQSVSGHIQGCVGYTGNPADSLSGFLGGASNVPLGELSFEGTACEAPLFSTFPSYCVAGAFDLHLDGQWQNVQLEEQHLIFSGALCSAQPLGDCPAQ